LKFEQPPPTIEVCTSNTWLVDMPPFGPTILYSLFNFGQKIWYKVWWAIGSILRNTLGTWGTRWKNPLRTWCEFIENLTWTHMIDNYHILHCVLIGPLPNMGPSPPPPPPQINVQKEVHYNVRDTLNGTKSEPMKAVFWGSYAEGAAALQWNKALIKVFF